MRRERGTSFIEVITALAIIAVLASMAVRKFSEYSANSKEVIAETNARDLRTRLEEYAFNYDVDHRYLSGNSAKKRAQYLNTTIEDDLDGNGGKKVAGYKNPYSQSDAVINLTNLPGRQKKPAVFITNNPKYAYTYRKKEKNGKGKGNSEVSYPSLAGSVVVYLRNSVEAIEIYWLDKDGKKSGTYFKLS